MLFSVCLYEVRNDVGSPNVITLDSISFPRLGRWRCVPALLRDDLRFGGVCLVGR